MKIAVVIPAINLWEGYTKPCIESLLEAFNEYPHRLAHDFKIYLIDNESYDNTAMGFTEYENRLPGRFERIVNPQSKGCAASWNLGVNKAIKDGYEYFFIVNNDTLFHPDCITKLYERITKDDYPAMVTAVNSRGECLEPNDINTLSMEGRDQCPESEHPDFSAFMLTKYCYDVVGEFDEGFAPAYFEDNDYHRRIKLAGLKAVCIPTALYYHFGSKTQNEATGRPIVSNGMFENNRAYFINKWGGNPDSESCRFINPFNDQSKSLKWTKQMTNENTNVNDDGTLKELFGVESNDSGVQASPVSNDDAGQVGGNGVNDTTSDDVSIDSNNDSVDSSDDLGDTQKHTITQEDLDRNPELVAEGLKVGDVIDLPPLSTRQDAIDAGIDVDAVEKDTADKLADQSV